MKKILLLICLFSGVCIRSFAIEELGREKKILIEFIKTDYYSWSKTTEQNTTSEAYPELHGQPNIDDELSTSKKSKAVSINKNIGRKQQSHYPSDDFTDFEFKIVNNQAIVQFTVGEQKISAFFEKENGKWKLICAANIDDPV